MITVELQENGFTYCLKRFLTHIMVYLNIQRCKFVSYNLNSRLLFSNHIFAYSVKLDVAIRSDCYYVEPFDLFYSFLNDKKSKVIRLRLKLFKLFCSFESGSKKILIYRATLLRMMNFPIYKSVFNF
jgi:hypothetical protein